MFYDDKIPALELNARQRQEELDDYKKLPLLKNVCPIDASPALFSIDRDGQSKLKKSAYSLSKKFLRDRIKPIGLDVQSHYMTIDKISQEATVSRQAMSARYGGNTQSRCPRIGRAALERHGMDDFMYLNNEMQPVAPSVPCAPGLFIGREGSQDTTGVKRLQTRLNYNEWLYVGQYEIAPSDPPYMTPEEWQDQCPRVSGLLIFIIGFLVSTV